MRYVKATLEIKPNRREAKPSIAVAFLQEFNALEKKVDVVWGQPHGPENIESYCADFEKTWVEKFAAAGLQSHTNALKAAVDAIRNEEIRDLSFTVNILPWY